MNDVFSGFIALASTIRLLFQFRDSSGTPTNASALPTYRTYGPNGTVMTNGTGTTAFFETGTVASSANNGAGLIRITTSTAHGLTTGTRITITGHSQASANGTFLITVISTTTFDLVGSTFAANGTGGSFNTTGLYYADIPATAGNGYERMSKYTTIAIGTVSVAKTYSNSFIVV